MRMQFLLFPIQWKMVMASRSIINNTVKAAVLAALMFIGVPAAAQKVSQGIADAMNAHKFYMKLSGQQAAEGTTVEMNVELAQKGEVAMSRAAVSGFNMVTLSQGANAFMLDEGSRSWRKIPAQTQPLATSPLKFSRQGKCKLNGRDFFFDEYKASDGTVLDCYYNADKVYAIELTQGAQKLGPLYLNSFTAVIPSNMYFCVGADWKGQGNPAPPKCASAWKDSGQRVELACGSGTGKITITAMTEGSVSQTQLASAQSAADPMSYTSEGVVAAIKELAAEMEGMSELDKKKFILEGASETSIDILTGTVDGKTVEKAVARCLYCPHPITYTAAGTAVREVAGPEKALPFFESADKMNPGNSVIVSNMAECYIEMDNAPKAETIILAAIKGEPDAAVLWHQLAGLCLKKENWSEAARALFKSMSLGYFDEFSAQMCMAIYGHFLGEFVPDATDYDYYGELCKIFNKENLGYLVKAISFDYPGIAPGIVPSYSFTWDLGFGDIKTAHKALREMDEDCLDEAKKQDKAAQANLEEINGELYLLMGIDPELYKLMCKQKQGGKDNVILDLTDARAFWSEFMLMTYYQSAISWLSGDQGRHPTAEHARYAERVKQEDDIYWNWRHEISAAQKAEEDAVSGPSMAENMRKLYQIGLSYARQIYDKDNVINHKKLALRKDYYTAEIQPVMEEYFQTAISNARYLSDPSLQTYFIKQAISTAYQVRADVYGTGATCGGNIAEAEENVHFYEDALAGIDAEIARAKREEKLERKRALEEVGAYRLYDFGETDRTVFGWDLMFAEGKRSGKELHISYTDGNLSVEFRDKDTGITKGIRSDGQSYSRIDQSIPSDPECAKLVANLNKSLDRKDVIDGIASTLIGQIPVIGELYDNYSKIAGALPGDSRIMNERYIARDAEGNLIQAMTKSKEFDMLSGDATAGRSVTTISGRRIVKDTFGVNKNGLLGGTKRFSIFSTKTSRSR